MPDSDPPADLDTTPRYSVVFVTSAPYAVPGFPWRVEDGAIDSGDPYIAACQVEGNATLIADALNR